MTMIFHIIMSLVEAIAYTCALLIGVIINVIWIISPKLSNKLADIVIDYVKQENNE